MNPQKKPINGIKWFQNGKEDKCCLSNLTLLVPAVHSFTILNLLLNLAQVVFDILPADVNITAIHPVMVYRNCIFLWNETISFKASVQTWSFRESLWWCNFIVLCYNKYVIVVYFNEKWTLIEIILIIREKNMFICILLNIFVCFTSVFNVHALKCMGTNSSWTDFFSKLKIQEFHYYSETKTYKIVDLVVPSTRDINYFPCLLNHLYPRPHFLVVGIQVFIQ